ncbi:MAG: hypothetical protein FE78DRAFT_33377 [Acidomyces sp. 'richmondensis']|nr:MAG: hypothetical protein FE78DRAFT_33377 [Acidomyces sp. 'richmondensis']
MVEALIFPKLGLPRRFQYVGSARIGLTQLRHRLQSERQLEQRTLEQSSNSYDKQLLSRIGGPNTPKRLSISSYSAGVSDASQFDTERRNSQLKPLSLPERRHAATNSIDSPASSRWPSSGAVSPGFAGFWTESNAVDSRASITRHSSIQFDDSTSHRGSYDHSMFMNEDFMEDGQMHNLNISDRSPSGSDERNIRAGSKRRASSPPREGIRDDRTSLSCAAGQSELYHRRSMQQLPNRGSPISRFHPSHSSVSSASSIPRHGSLSSSLGVSSIPSSATSYCSGHLSPGALSHAGETNLGTSYGSTKIVTVNHQRAGSESAQSSGKPSSDHTEPSSHSTLPHAQSTYVCECCPKKPKKFKTADDLRIHESEKQYTCQYCSNRFKNKNEAERHQNSLHLRKHSWSCAALSGVESAFHTSSTENGTDICGFCGEEFSNPPQWDIRAEHVNHKHKFGECNLAKKFFRADHFRQHLKHSHAGTSGKWTNMLENACMKDEPPPEKRATSGGMAIPPSLILSTAVLTGMPQGGRGSTLPDTANDA